MYSYNGILFSNLKSKNFDMPIRWMNLKINNHNEKSQTLKRIYYKTLFIQNFGERKLPYSDRKEISGSVGLGQRE